ncbi:UNKNOWN [Stylonychia lemnae]|uniref:Cilia- and flagella-associated protein 58 central coiled coil domain-containing protein n=1 Tax=Stylonychia lemnae TaxID=5949 RepID=A0A078BAW8_STYLE|nr:UNKNOWN [Stylonychia lemnae]|eukprot:CDW91529.1 UNKNOWN [Stylonychia lemnae]
MASNDGDIKNIQNTEAFTILQDLTKHGQLSQDAAEVYRQKFYQLHEVLVTNMENEQQLMKRARTLQKELQNEVLKLEKAQQQQKQNEETLKELNNTINDVRRTIETIEERRQVLRQEIHQLENEKQDLEGDIIQKQTQERERIIPEMQKIEAAIAEITQEIAQNDVRIQKEDKTNQEIEEKLNQMDKEKEEFKDKIESLQQEFLKERDEPNRLGKVNENLKKAVDHLRTDYDSAVGNIKTQDLCIEAETKAKKQYDESTIQFKKEQTDKDARIKELDTNIKRLRELSQSIDKDILNITEERVLLDTQIKVMESNKKRQQEKINHYNKRIDDEKKLYKKIEYENNNLINNIKELETQIANTHKFLDEKKKEAEQLLIYKKNLEEEQQIFVGQLVKKGLEEKNMQAKIVKIRSDILQHEKQVQQFQEEENKWVEEIKFLSTIREKMARTASQAMAQARETKEELKVKELLILDLTKKQQETEFRLNSFIALYEEVKNARNKYVSQIQNSSQDLAEMKERIKILQNEVEILRNESSEKDRALVDIKHQVQKEIYKRDSLRAELNKKDFVYKSKQSIIGQKINEGDKLNLIINSLQKEMNDLIYKYEMACESRNYMGIQLIDRNDELCILYEKSNIQENILKDGEQQIRQKEEEIRMINLELKERQRQLEVVRKQIPEVPQLAESVIDLKKKLDKEREKVEQLSEMLENPGKHPKWRDLGGEDPDQEALQAKIQVLEERLNNKKESLLEKELVYEEVSNLAEKLRTQALDGRKGTLEIAEKINEYKARTTDLSRKMLATVSELSMFQSKALKLQQEKEEKEGVIEEAMRRIDSGLPPTDTCDQEWEKIERNRYREQTDKEERAQRKLLEQQLPPTGVKTTALPRPNSYMPSDIQIPKPYGIFSPFMPSEPGASMRHVVKPKIREIEY